jgi:tetratricopeptide (TPR) repeat protein
VRAIANKLLFDFDNSIMNVPGTLKARRLLVTTALEYLDKLAKDADDDLNLENDLANAYIGVGKIQYEPTHAHIFDRPGAVQSFKKSVELARHLVSKQPDEPRFRLTLALALARYGSTAYPMEREPSIAACHESLAILRSLAEQFPDHRVAEIDIGAVLFSLGWALTDTGKLEDGLATRKQALEYFERLKTKRPDDIDVVLWVAACQLMYGRSLQLAGNLDDAARYMETARAFHAEMARRNPNSLLSRRTIATTDAMLGEVRAEQKDFRRAAELYARALEGLESLATIDPENVQARMDYGMSLHRLAELQAVSGDNDAAIRTFETRFLPMVQKRYNPGHPTLVQYQIQYAALLRRGQRLEDAQRVLSEAQRNASGARIGDVAREQIALYEQWGKPDLAAEARQRLAGSPAATTQSAH